jgi:hypothetical protein
MPMFRLLYKSFSNSKWNVTQNIGNLSYLSLFLFFAASGNLSYWHTNDPPYFSALLQQYFSAAEQYFSLTTNQHQQQPNFSETNRAISI